MPPIVCSFAFEYGASAIEGHTEFFSCVIIRYTLRWEVEVEGWVLSQRLKFKLGSVFDSVGEICVEGSV